MTGKFNRVFITFSLILSLVAFAASPGVAGVLNGNSSAVTFSSFSGSGSFLNGPLAGTLDYAVFTAAEFATAFPSSPYSPLGDVVYAYQVENTGTVEISTEIVGITNPVSGDIDSFTNTTGEVSPGAQFFSGANAIWSFSSPSLGPTLFSEILVFSSPNIPMLGASLSIDGGTSVVLTGVPTPSATPIPEPATFSLAAAGVLAMFVFSKKRRD